MAEEYHTDSPPRARDLVQGELVDERSARDAEDLGGTGLVARTGIERRHDAVALRIRRKSRGRGGRSSERRIEHEVLGTYFFVMREQHRAVDHAAKLAHIAWPGVRLEQG